MPLVTGCSARFAYNNYLNISSTILNSPTSKDGLVFSRSYNDFRTSVWRMGVRFLIDSTNEKLYFNDGSDKIATIANLDSYSSGADLATAITAAMNTVGSGFTVTYSTTTNKFTIANASAFVLQYSTTTNAIWNTLGFINTVDSSSSTSIASDEARRHFPYELIKMDLGHSAEVGLVALLGIPGQEFSLNNQSTITIMANNVDDFTAPPLNRTVSHTDRDFGVFDWIIDEDSSYRFWEIRITDFYGANEIDIGNLYVGSAEGFANTNIEAFTKVIRDTSLSEKSEDGTEYFDVKPNLAGLDNVSIGLATGDDLDLVLDIFNRLGRHTPFYFSIDPDVKISNRTSDLTKYVFFDSEPSYRHVFFNQYGINFNLREAV